MKEYFKKFSHRLTDEERETIWRGISPARNHEEKRRIQFWTGLSVSAAAVTALLFIAFFAWGPKELGDFDRLAMAPDAVEKVAGEPPVFDEQIAFEAREMDARGEAPQLKPSGSNDLDGMKVAAAPATPEENPTVAASDHARRESAAFSLKEPDASQAPVKKRDSGRIGSEDVGLPSGAAKRKGDAAARTEAAAPTELRSEAPQVLNEGLPTESVADRRIQAAKTAPESAGMVRSSAGEAPARDRRDWREEARRGFGLVYGSVVNADTGQPLAYANVVLEGTHFGAMVLEDGSFSFRAPCGVYTVVVTFLGYERLHMEDIVVCGGAPASLDFALIPSIALKMESIVVEGYAPQVDVKTSMSKKGSEEQRRYAGAHDKSAMALDAGIVIKNNEIHMRGGRSGEISYTIDDLLVDDRWEGRHSDRRRDWRRRCWWTPPDWHYPNGEPFDAMYFEHYGVNPFIVSDEDALSTFAVDVDNASYTLMRRYLETGHLPPKEAVRVEEYVNFFDQGYKPPRKGDFAIYTDGAPSPFGDGYHLLRVGIKGREISESQRKTANLVFVIDTSGSMAREDRLGLVKRALHILLDELRDSDTVGIVEYGSRGRVLLPPTSVEDRRRIERVINHLQPNGSTNAEEGLELGYEMASRNYGRGAINRLILCSDGVANTGETQAERILDRVRYQSDRGIHLSTIGFGMGNYNDVLMEKLADQGDGNYYYVDDLREAERVFIENLTATLQTIARDTKVQVEFDSETVLRWRLLGYENRDVADRDFRNDEVDAGEVGAGHEVTALYELKLSPEAAERLENRSRRGRKSSFLATVRLRYEIPQNERREAGKVIELEHRAGLGDFSPDFGSADEYLQLDVLVAEFAEILRGSYWAKGSRIEDLDGLTRRVARHLREDEAVQEFSELVERAARLEERER